jgi:hypothetical protein
MVKSSKKGGFVSDEQHIKSTTVNAPYYHLNLFPKHNVSEEHHMINQEHSMKPMHINKQHGSSKTMVKKSKKGGNSPIPHEEFEHMDYPIDNLTYQRSHHNSHHPRHHEIDHPINNLTYTPPHKGGSKKTKENKSKKGGNLLIPNEEFEHMNMNDKSLKHIPSHKMNNLKGGNPFMTNYASISGEENNMGDVSNNWGSARHEDTIITPNSDWNSSLNQNQGITAQMGGVKRLKKKTDKSIKKKSEKTVKKKTLKTVKKKIVKKGGSETDYANISGNTIKSKHEWAESLKENVYPPSDMNIIYHEQTGSAKSTIKKRSVKPKSDKKKVVKPKSDKKKIVKPKSDKKKVVKPKSDKKKKVVKLVKKH